MRVMDGEWTCGGQWWQWRRAGGQQWKAAVQPTHRRHTALSACSSLHSPALHCLTLPTPTKGDEVLDTPLCLPTLSVH